VHLVLLNLAFRTDLRTPEELWERFGVLRGWVRGAHDAARREGLDEPRITVVQRFHNEALIERDDVTCRFVTDGHGAELAWWQSSRPALDLMIAVGHRAVQRGSACVVHLNGLDHFAGLRRLRHKLPRSVPIVVQHHAERPRSGISGLAQRRGLAVADGVLFAARGLADPWFEAGQLPRDLPVFEVMEGSTDFIGSDRETARRQSGLTGAPIFLWVGRLDENKDPLTVLEALETVLPGLPEARVYMAWGDHSPLRSAVEDRIESSDVLRGTVRLLGTLPHHRMEEVFNSADYFLLGSRYEGSGFALVEALACGVVPIVTDIPSFRVMTDSGAFGGLWSPGRPEDLASVLRKVLDRNLHEQSNAAREFFDRRLSYRAIGHEAMTAYREVVRRRGRVGEAM
jgi:glycosyltransferase involved in cell wall biosynthesis